MAINYESYRIFYYVARYGSLTRAAEALFSSQPNVTRAMNQLERELGCRLMTRTNRGVTLTVEGERLYTHVAVAQEQLQMGEAEVSMAAGLQAGSVVLGASETALHLYLLERLQRFRQAYPQVRLKINNLTTPQALAALRAGQIDLAVVTLPAEIPGPFAQVKLQSFRDRLIGGPGFEALSDKPLQLCQLEAHPLICLGRQTATYDFYNRFYLSQGLVLEPDIEVATADLVLPMIESGLGLGFLPEAMARRALKAGRVFQIALEQEPPRRHIGLVHDPKGRSSRAAQALRAMLCESGEPGPVPPQGR